jgi:hypothetical protein
LSGSAFKAGYGYIVGVPVVAYLTWEGRLIEGKGASPNIPVALFPEQLLASEDPQNAEIIGTCARALTQVATQAVIAQARPCTPSRRIKACLMDAMSSLVRVEVSFLSGFIPTYMASKRKEFLSIWSWDVMIQSSQELIDLF